MSEAKHNYKVGDHIDLLIGKEWRKDYATIIYFEEETNLPVAEMNYPAHDGCRWCHAYQLDSIRLT